MSCKNCERRQVGCHSHCLDYLAYKVDIERGRNIQLENDLSAIRQANLKRATQFKNYGRIYK